MKERSTAGPGDDRQDAEAVLRDEVEHLSGIIDRHEQTIAALRREVDLHRRSVGWRLQQRLIPLRRALLSAPVVRQIYRTFYRAMEIWVDESFLMIFARTGHKLGLAMRGRNFLVEGADRRPARVEDYESWLRGAGAPPAAQAVRDAIARLTTTPCISVLVLLDGAEVRVDAVIATLVAQSYERWEACLAISSTARARLGRDLDAICLRDPRIRFCESAAVPTWPDALRLATGDYIAFLEPGDELAPDALLELVKRLNESGADIVYSDEDWIAENGRREDPLFKPDWGPDLLLSTNYLERLGLFRRQLVEEAGGFRPAAWRGQVYDLVLRLTEHTDRIAHVPKVLYHSRRRPATADALLARRAAGEDESRVLADALRRRGTAGRATAIFTRNGPRGYTTRYDLRQRPLVSIVIPTRDKQPLLQTTLDSIWSRTDYDRYEIIVVDNQSRDQDAVRYLASLPPRCQVLQWSQPFNYSAINNFGVQHARGEQVLFLNNDVEVIRPDWLVAMLEHAERPDVGAVGARLLYGDGRIQHAGVVVGINRVAANAFRSWPGETTGNLRLADLTRNCSAVTGACMMVPRRIFDEVGGFDEDLRVVLNDVDLCLKIRQRGYLVVYTPDALLYHYEGSSRGRLHPPPDEKVFGQRWSDVLDRGDPYYNPNLSDRHDDWRIKIEGRDE
jgi:GT2 family glycosyltransferase